MGFFKFSLHIAANLLCSCFYLFGTIIELHAMHEKEKVLWLSQRQVQMNICLINAYLIHDYMLDM